MKLTKGAGGWELECTGEGSSKLSTYGFWNYNCYNSTCFVLQSFSHSRSSHQKCYFKWYITLMNARIGNKKHVA